MHIGMMFAADWLYIWSSKSYVTKYIVFQAMTL